MSLHVLLEILGTLEGLATEVALVRLERDVDADVRSDVVTLDGRGAAVAPLASQVEIVGALAANVTLANVILAGINNTRLKKGQRNLHRGVRRCSGARRSSATGM